jgi:hypothetical protein
VTDIGQIPDVSTHILNPGDDYCFLGKTGSANNLWFEWQTTFGHHDNLFTRVDYKGIIKQRGTFMAPQDLPFSHEHKDCGDFGILSEIESIGEWALSEGAAWTCDHAYLAFVPPFQELMVWGVIANDCKVENICPSDWNLLTRPLPRYWNQLAGNYADAQLESEWEQYWGRYVWVHGPGAEHSYWLGFSNFDSAEDEYVTFALEEGDMVHLNGRPIIDCGHDNPYRSEIHPPNTVVDIRGQQNSDFAPVLTRAQIWLNAFYQSQGPGVTIWAPPRPSADAILAVWHPSPDSEGKVGLNIKSKYSFLPEGVKVDFYAPPNYDYIDDTYGQLVYPGDQDESDRPSVTAPCDENTPAVCVDQCNQTGQCVLEHAPLRSYAALWKVRWN